MKEAFLIGLASFGVTVLAIIGHGARGLGLIG